MATKTNLNSAPYFDDFNEKKNFHKVLFKPGMAVQARELTQMQTILQNQIERFGNNILREGTIISGCNFVEILDMGHVKVGDLETSGVPVAMNAYRGALAVGTVSGVEAEIQEVEVGYESQAPDLNTLYVKYIKVGNTYSSAGRTLNYKKFLANENIEVRMKSTRDLIGTLTGRAVGNSYAVRVTDGVIFQKGFFIRVEPQIAIVSKYDNIPDNVVVGFQTNEELVNSHQDTSLLDNATGSNNENAPGADRLKLIPILVRKTLEEANDDDRFFAIQEYQNGKVIRRNRETQYAGIMSQIEQRTKEESGNYTLSDFPLSISSTGDPNYLSVNIGRGTAYVEGKRVELLNTYDLMLGTATNFKKENSQSIATNYGNYILLTDFMGDFDFSSAQEVRFYNTQQNAATGGAIPAPTGTLIGTAKARSFVLDSGVAGTPTAVYRLYIFDISMNSGRSFSEVQSAYSVATTGGLAAAGDLVSATVYENKFDKMIFPIGRSSIKSVPAPATSADYVMRATNRDLSVQTNGSMTIALSEGEWAYTGSLNSTQLREIILIPKVTNGANYVTGRPLDMSGASATVSGNTLTITGLPTVGAVIPVIGYFNIKINATQPTAKELGTYYLKIRPSSHPNGVNGPWCLGLPDVYSIEAVYVNSFYSLEEQYNKTSYFTLDNGQKDSHYGLSYLKKAKPIDLNGQVISVKLKAFTRNISGVYADAFFTVNSYPVNDLVTSDTTIKTQDIPVYVSDDGSRYNLRDSIDFRPYAGATISYFTTLSGSPENPSSAENFFGARMFPAPNKEFETDYEYYLARKDLLVLNEEGKFEIIGGTPSVNAVPPAEPNKGMVLATINLPPYPSLEKREADIIGKSEMGVTLIRKNNRRYTMRDIGGLDQRLTNMEYYTTLSALETSTKDMVVADAAGNNRFKNGIFADSFEDFAAAAVASPEFSAAIDPAFNELTPKFKAYPLDLKISSYTNCKDYGEVLTLAKDSEVAFIKSPYATNYRNCVTDFWKFNGTMTISPKYDSAHDTSTAPNININVDMTTPFVDFTQNLHQVVPLTRTSSTTASTVRTTQTANTTARVTTSTTTSTTNSTTNTLRLEGKTTVQDVGDYVTDIRFSPYLRSRNISIFVSGLRPNTVHYFYFDGVDVTKHVAPAKISNGALVKTGANGTVVKTDASGNIKAIFLIPPSTFFVGDRVLTINDIDDMDNIDASVSSASATYSGFNFSTTKQGLSVTTRAPDFSISSSSSSRTTTTTTSVVNPIPRPVVPTPSVPTPTNPTANTTPRVFTPRRGLRFGDGDNNEAGGNDPIAQTFKVSKNHSADDVVMVDRLDLFFKDKHPSYGVTIQIRECENGYPGKRILTFGQKHLNSTEVNISNTGLVATPVIFDAPVVLKTDMEYCFVILPDANNPDYLTWISRTGEKDVFTGQVINQDTNSGTLFTSTNNSAWTANQNENIKFTIYKNVYREKTGVVYLTNKENEFFTYTPTAGTFLIGEQVGLLTANATGSATTTLGDSTVTGTGFNIFSPGEWIGIYQTPTDIELYKIQTVNSSTSIEIVGSPKAAGTGLKYFRTAVGEVTYNNKNTPATLHLENSSAKSGLLFTAGATIVGEISGTKATIDSVDDLDVSYLQPNIYKNIFTNTKMALYSDRLTDKTTRTVYAEDAYIPFNTETYLTQKDTVIKSRSKELQEGTGKSFQLRLDMMNTNESEINSATPFLDYAISNFMAYTYEINNILSDTEGDEKTGNGPAKSKYISKPINLASGFEAEDLRVWLTAYRPPGTDIEVYAKIQNPADTRKHADVEWTRLVMKDESRFLSSGASRFDYREFEFNLPVLPASSIVAGGGSALNTNNSNIIRYVAPNGSIYNDFGIFSLKIVMLSTGHRIVPKVKDIRAIALT